MEFDIWIVLTILSAVIGTGLIYWIVTTSEYIGDPTIGYWFPQFVNSTTNKEGCSNG